MRRRKIKIDLLRLFAILFVAFWIILFYENIFFPKSIPAPLQIFKINRSFNLLILGTDLYFNAETRKTKPGHTDTIILCRYDYKNNKIYLVSIPRDSYVNIPKYGMNKINYAFVRGGVALARETVENLTDREIDKYIVISTNLVKKTVDLVGGVYIEVDKDMKYTDRAQDLRIDLKKGWQTLNGEQATQFIRYRWDVMGDITRVERQQRFMKALLKKITRPYQLIKAPLLISLFTNSIKTNLSAREFILFINSMRMLGSDDIKTFILPGSTRDEEPGNWFINKAGISVLMDQHF